MANQNSSLRFDHREIAVIFSLFIFVSLLMFTVGILVGKGLAQAQFQGAPLADKPSTHVSERTPAHEEASPHHGTSITTEHKTEHKEEHSTAAKPSHAEEAKVAAGAEHTNDKKPALAEHEAPEIHPEEDKHEKQELQLVPKKKESKLLAESSGEKNPEHEKAMKNPKIAGLFDDGAKASRHTASTTVKMSELPGLANGKYTVQVGSYPTQKDADERVQSFKKLGFPYAYFSAKQLGETKETWYRVWLGYYNDSETAKKSGESLQARGEVKNYLVRKTDSEE